MAIEALGRLYNIVPSAAGVSISLKNTSGVTFVVSATAAAVITVNSQPSAGGTATACAAISRYYTTTAANGSAPWTATDQSSSPSSTVNVAAGSVVAFYVDAAALPAGAAYAEAVVTSGTATVIAVLSDLAQPEDPSRLALPVA